MKSKVDEIIDTEFLELQHYGAPSWTGGSQGRCSPASHSYTPSPCITCSIIQHG